MEHTEVFTYQLLNNLTFSPFHVLGHTQHRMALEDKHK